MLQRGLLLINVYLGVLTLILPEWVISLFLYLVLCLFVCFPLCFTSLSDCESENPAARITYYFVQLLLYDFLAENSSDTAIYNTELDLCFITR